MAIATTTTSISNFHIPMLELRFDNEPDEAKEDILNVLPPGIVAKCDVIVAVWPHGVAVIKNHSGRAAPAVVMAPDSEKKG